MFIEATEDGVPTRLEVLEAIPQPGGTYRVTVLWRGKTRNFNVDEEELRHG